MTCLLAVTTLLPIASAAAIRVWAGSSPPISSTMTSISSSATRWAGASERSSAGTPAAVARPGSRTATAVSWSRGAVGRMEVVGTLEQGADHLAADRPGAEDTDAQAGAAHDVGRAGRDIRRMVADASERPPGSAVGSPVGYTPER